MKRSEFLRRHGKRWPLRVWPSRRFSVMAEALPHSSICAFESASE
jgi:hypothetical protein